MQKSINTHYTDWKPHKMVNSGPVTTGGQVVWLLIFVSDFQRQAGVPVP